MLPEFLPAFGLVAVIMVVTALVSGAVERSPLSFPILFLGLGLLLGESGFGLLEMGPHDPILEVVAALTLTLVLFLDALNLQVEELGRRWLTPALILGPGTALIISLGALPLALLLGFGWLVAFIGGAILASTDPVVLRELLRDPRVPRSVRQVLKIEAGTNDIIVLPVILVLIAIAQAQGRDMAGWSVFLAQLLLLGPAIGFAIGGVGSWLMNWLDARMNIRREHQSFYGIGLVLAAFAAATAAGGDGFLAAFAAGLAVVLLNQRLCDCFMEYGEVTSEMAMLLAFVLFGAVLSGILDTVNMPLAVALAAIVIFGLRPSVLGLLLARTRLSLEAKGLIAWFGPRGLNSLMLALLAVQADIPGAEVLLATVGVVVIASVAIHGASTTPLGAWYGRRAARVTLAEEREGTADGLFARDHGEVRLVSPDELHEIAKGPNPPIVLDVRSRSSYEGSLGQIPGSVRVLPDEISEWATARPRGDTLVVAYCA